MSNQNTDESSFGNGHEDMLKEDQEDYQKASNDEKTDHNKNTNQRIDENDNIFCILYGDDALENLLNNSDMILIGDKAAENKYPNAPLVFSISHFEVIIMPGKSDKATDKFQLSDNAPKKCKKKLKIERKKT